ncbi:hypothetical protein [Sporomusa acidovorans]|uniref:Uncharacterized protein n=1 Tax=Sporomusa acidovorans (strain ATCC 49682 / DSM 3132 / Mol) TaxID=1123286 RepID=A0ABZ3J6A3_SPOA4|nr:hypothetical protein [Sporomusa acidovorans]OZC23830.1 hypothetical protein SPACI_04550 [Sporomusa acidovorans DSM 3132]SDF62420.1 hypothetical protein SAMN04488499_106335 [Sporomusa acidovorans]
MIIKYVRYQDSITIKPENDIERNIASSQQFLEFSNQLLLKNKFKPIDNAVLYSVKDEITQHLLTIWNYPGSVEVVIQ